MIDARLAPAALAVLCVGWLGCAAASARTATPPEPARDKLIVIDGATDVYDHQACAENALRRGADASLVAETAAHVKRTCAAGEIPSCSILGVMYEVGAGVAQDRDQAMTLFRRACDAGNDRACGNLGELMVEDSLPGQAPETGRALLRRACDAGQGRPCAALARIQLNQDAARTFFERACTQGDGPGCYEFAQWLAKSVNPEDNTRVTELLATACTRGHAKACSELVKSARPGEPPQGPVVARVPAP